MLYHESSALALEPAVPPVAGGVISLYGIASNLLVVLSSPDSDGFVRFAPLVTQGILGEWFGLALDTTDFTEGGMAGTAGWVRLDRVGWRHIDSAQQVGMLK